MKTKQNTSSGKRTIIAPSGIVLFIMILFWIFGGQKSFAQGVGISEASITPDPSAILELKYSSGTYKGFLPPRMTGLQRDGIVAPATGLIIFNTTTNKLNIYNGTLWVALFSGSSGVNSVSGTADRISISGTSDLNVDIAGTYLGQTSIMTLGTITSGTWNGTAIGIAYGGTGQTTAQLAINALAGGVTSGQYLRGNGTNVEMSAIQASDVPPLNQNTTGNAATATNLAGGSIGLIPYQSGANTTVLLPVGSAGQVLQSNGAAAPSWVTKNNGTVSTVSVISANGFAGTVATATTTPAITLTTSVTGLLKGDGTAISAATAGTDYSAGTSGLSTGILKSTTVTGALTTAVAGDFPILNQNTTGNASTVTTNANLTGMVTSVGNATTVVTNANLTGPIISIGNATSVASQTGIGSTFVMSNSPTLVTPNIGAATGTSLTVTGAISSTGTAGIGYATGAGGTITQITNKGTPVTINKICGVITTDNSNLNSWTTASFTVNNSTVSATDVPVVAFSGGSTRSYVVTVTAVTNGSFEITILNATGGNRSEVLVINYAIIKAVIN